jgi:succinate dehydrogenase/fumarate reductase cytochrome b subunit
MTDRPATENDVDAPRPGDPSGARLSRVQAYSGLLFALFLVIHLANQAVAALGMAQYDEAQRVLRRAYQWAPLELSIVIAPLLVHVAAAIARMAARRRRGLKAPANRSARLHRLSGLVLLVFFAGHVAATRGASLLYGVYPGFQGIAFTLRWVAALFWPYYLLFGIAAVYHLVHGLGVALPLVGAPAARVLRRPAIWGPIVLAGSLCILAGILGFGGVLFPVEHPERAPYPQLLIRLGVASRDAAGSAR